MITATSQAIISMRVRSKPRSQILDMKSKPCWLSNGVRDENIYGTPLPYPLQRDIEQYYRMQKQLVIHTRNCSTIASTANNDDLSQISIQLKAKYGAKIVFPIGF